MLQTQQPMLQQRIRNQVVVVLDLRLTEINVTTQQLQCGWRRRRCHKGFFLTVNRFSVQLGCVCAHSWGSVHVSGLTCRAQGWSSVRPPLDAPGVWDTVLSRGSADTDHLLKTHSLTKTTGESRPDTTAKTWYKGCLHLSNSRRIE